MDHLSAANFATALTRRLKILFFALALCMSFGVAATKVLFDDLEISALGFGDQRHLSKQRASIAALARRHLGRDLSGVKSRDLEILQDLLDRSVVTEGQTLELQAMGVIFGDLMAKEHRLKWVIYEDLRGRSRALQMDDRNVYLFPITIISRRVDTGLDVSVVELYENAIGAIQAELQARYEPEPPIR